MNTVLLLLGMVGGMLLFLSGQHSIVYVLLLVWLAVTIGVIWLSVRAKSR